MAVMGTPTYHSSQKSTLYVTWKFIEWNENY